MTDSTLTFPPPAEAPAASPAGLGVPSDDAARTARDKLVGGGFAVLAVAYVLSTVAAVIGLLGTLDRDAAGREVASSALSLVSEVTLAAAFALAAAGVLGARRARASKLMAAAALGAAGFLAGFIAYGLNVLTDLDADLMGSGVASDALAAAAYLGSAVAAVVAALTFSAAAKSGAEQVDGRRLGVAAAIAAAGFVATTAGNVATAIFYGDIEFTSGMVNALWVATAAAVLTVVAATLAARAFPQAGRAVRDGGLSAAAGAFAAGAAVNAVAYVVMVLAADDNGFEGRDVTALWLTTAAWVGIAVAVAIVAAGFARSRRGA